MASKLRILVIGPLGTVGVWVTQQLLEAGHDVIGLDVRDDYSLRPALKGAFQLYKQDLRDPDGLAEIMRKEHIEVVCHLAARTTGTANIHDDPDPYLSFVVNAIGPVGVFEAARHAGIGRIVYASSRGVYGELDGKYGPPQWCPVPEEHPRRAHWPSRQYDSAKILAEEAGRYYADRFDLSFRALRFSNIIRPGKEGPGGAGAALFPAIVGSVLRGEPVTLEVSEGAKDDLVYVKDIARAFLLAATVENVSNWAFNIGTGQPSTLVDFADALRLSISGAKIDVRIVPDTDNYKIRSILNIDRARAELGYEPRFDLKATVEDLITEMA